MAPLTKYTGNEVCGKCGGTGFSITLHSSESRCPLAPEEHMHLTCGKCANESAVAPMDRPDV